MDRTSTPARGLVSDRESGRRVDVGGAGVTDALAPFAAAFWTSQWDLRGQPPHEMHLVSDPCMHIVIESAFDEDGAVVVVEGRVVGVWTRLFSRTLVGRGRIRALKLKPGGARALFPSPSSLRDRISPLSLLTPRADELARHVVAAASDEEAFAVFADVVAGCVVDHDEADVSLATALVERVAVDRGIVSVDDLVACAGLSLRPLQRLFRDCVGASPKWVIRRARLQEAAERLKHDDVAIKDLAVELGYADQAHFSRDFKDTVGVAPAAFVRRHAPGRG